MTPALIRTRHVSAFVDHQRNLGHPVESRLERAGIPADCLAADTGALPASYFAQFLSSTCAAGQLSAVSFQAAPEGLHAYPGLAEQIAGSANLHEALASRRVGGSELSGLSFHRMVRASRTWLCGTSTSPCLNDLGWSAYLLRPMIELVRVAAGPAWWPETVRLPSAHTVRMQRPGLPPCVAVELGADRVAVAVPEDLLFRPIDRPPAGDDHSDGDDLGELPTDLVGAIRLLLKTYMGKRPLPISEVADLAGCSVRSLQRELRSADCSFSSLLQEVRFQSSIPLLINSETPITELAYELGYSDPAHFSRAFQRFSGTSPSAFRRLANNPA